MTKNREAAIDKVAERIETEFLLVGSSAIEDKLQDEVGPVIDFIK